MRFRLMVVAALIGAPVAAQDLPSLSEVTAEIDGREVQVSGLFGKHVRPNSRWSLQAGDGYYETTLAVDRETLNVIEKCQIGPAPSEQGCRATVAAETDIVGGKIELIVFKVELE